MADEKADEKRISAEEAFHRVGEVLEAHSAHIDNHAKQLANHQEILTAMSTLVEMLKVAVLDLQVRAGLKPTGSEPVN